MIDAQILAAHRRNTLILNSLVLLLALSGKKILDFEILGIKFAMSDNIPYISSFNDIILIMCAYSFFRYLISYKQYSILEIKKTTLIEINTEKEKRKELRDEGDFSRLWRYVTTFFIDDDRMEFSFPTLFVIFNIYAIENFNLGTEFILIAIVMTSILGVSTQISEEHQKHISNLTKQSTS